MPEQREVIVYEAVDRTGAATKSANSNIEEIEKKSKSAGERVSSSIGKGIGQISGLSSLALDHLRSLEDRSVSVGQKITSGFRSAISEMSRLKDLAGQVAVSVAAAGIVAAASGAQTASGWVAAEKAVNGFRVGRLALAATEGAAALAATAAPIAAAIGLQYAFEQTLKTADQVRSIALEASATKQSFQSAAVLNFAETVQGRNVGELSGLGKSAEQLSAIAKELDGIADPAQRADRATEEFGKNAGAALQILNKRTAEAIDSAKGLASQLDYETRVSVEYFKKDIESTFDPLREMAQLFRQVKEEAGLAVAASLGSFRRIGGLAANARNQARQSNPITGEPLFSSSKLDFDVEHPFIPSPLIEDPTNKKELFRANSEFTDRLAKRFSGKAGLRDNLSFQSSRFAKLNSSRLDASLDARPYATEQANQALSELQAAEKKLEIFEKSEEFAKRAAAAEKATHDGLIAAQFSEGILYGKLFIQKRQAIEQNGLTKKSLEEINQTFDILAKKEEKVLLLDQKRRFEAQAEADLKLTDARNRVNLESLKTTASLLQEGVRQRLEIDLQGIEASRDAQLRSLDGINALTLAEKIQLEDKKGQIEIDYIRRAQQLREPLLQAEEERALEALKNTNKQGLLDEGLYEQQKAAIKQSFALKGQKQEEASSAAINQSIENTTLRSIRVVQQYNQELFDSFKHEAGGVFNALLSRSQNVFQAIGNAFKTAILTAVKDIVTSNVAAKLTELVTGTPVTLQSQTPGAGPLGKIASALGLGAKPVFGAKLEANGHLGDVELVGKAVPVVMVGPGGSPVSQTAAQAATGGFGGLGGSLASLGILSGLISARTPPFVGGGSAVSSSVDFGGGAQGLGTTVTGGAGQATGGVGGIGGFGGLFSSFKGLLGGLGNIGRGGTVGDIPGGITGQVGAAQRGIGGATGGALLAGGGILAFDGLRRGGLLGLGETTAGGALIGAKFGGPIGAVIGASVGLVAGLIRLNVKGQDEKIVEKVKSIYGITIDKAFARDPIAKLIKANYGGNLEVGLRSPDVRSLLELYAQSRLTTEESANFPLSYKPYNVGLAISGGQTYQTAASVDGQSIGYGGGSASLIGSVDRLISGTTAPAQGHPSQVLVQLTLNGASADKLLAGNPVAVGNASNAASRLSVNRQQQSVDMNTPGLLLA